MGQKSGSSGEGRGGRKGNLPGPGGWTEFMNVDD